MNDTTIRVLTDADAAPLLSFYHQHIETSMFPLSNIRDAGIEDHGQTFQGTYVGAFDAEGNLYAVVTHTWSGSVLVQAPGGPEQDLLDAMREAKPKRPVTAIFGPYDQVVRTQRGLGLEDVPCARESRELLYALSLESHEPHPLLSQDSITARLASDRDLEVLTRWRTAYHVEALWEPPESVDHERVRASVTRGVARQHIWILCHHEEPVACTGINASLPEVFQIGGVWTPPEHRGRGYARAVVSHQLVEMRRAGSLRAILFTDEENIAAQKAYQSLGFTCIGEFGMFVGYPS